MRIFIIISLLVIILSCEKEAVNSEYDFSTEQAEYPLTLTTPSGEITIKSKPIRLVSMTLSTDEILFELYKPNEVFAVSYLATNKYFSHVYNKIEKNTHIVGSDVESILSLNPDLIFIASYLNQDTKNALKLSGVNIYDIETLDNIKKLKKSIYEISLILDKKTEGLAILSDIDTRLNKVKDNASKMQNKPRVLFLSMNGYVRGSGTSFEEICNYANIINVASELGFTGDKEIPYEILLKADIDYLITSEYNISDDKIKDFFYNHPIYKAMNVVSNKNIIIFNHKDISPTSQYLINAIEIFSDKMIEISSN